MSKQRANFTKPTKRAALKRSGGKCEAIGPKYELPEGTRCNAPLIKGVEYDHINLEANSHDNSLENCASVCVKCHAIKTRKHDIPLAAKTLRQQDKHNGITVAKSVIPSRPFVTRFKPEKGAGFSPSHKAHLEKMQRKHA